MRFSVWCVIAIPAFGNQETRALKICLLPPRMSVGSLSYDPHRSYHCQNLHLRLASLPHITGKRHLPFSFLLEWSLRDLVSDP